MSSDVFTNLTTIILHERSIDKHVELAPGVLTSQSEHCPGCLDALCTTTKLHVLDVYLK